MWTSFVLRSTLRMLHKITPTSVNTFNQGPLIVLPLFGFFWRCPHWFCPQNKTGDSTPTRDCCPSIVKVPGLNTHTNTHPHPHMVGYLTVRSIVPFLKNSLVRAHCSIVARTPQPMINASTHTEGHYTP